MKIGMSRRVDSEFASSTGGTCPSVVAGGALGFVAQLMGGGVDVAATTGIVGVASSTGGTCPSVVAGCALGFVAQLMGGGVDVAATTGIVGVLGNKSVVV